MLGTDIKLYVGAICECRRDEAVLLLFCLFIGGREETSWPPGTGLLEWKTVV